jgi:hypothetical protein
MWTANRTHPSEYRSEAGVRVESRAYSGATVSTCFTDQSYLNNPASIGSEAADEGQLRDRHIS